MFDIDQFIDACESMKINEWDYNIGIGNEGIGKIIAKGAKGIWSAIIKFFTTIGKMIGSAIHRAKDFFKKSDPKLNKEMDDVIYEEFYDDVEAAEAAASKIDELESMAETFINNHNERMNYASQAIKSTSEDEVHFNYELNKINEMLNSITSNNREKNGKQLPVINKQLPSVRQMPVATGRKTPPAVKTYEIMDRLNEIEINSCRIADKMKRLTADSSNSTALTLYGNTLNNMGTAVSTMVTAIISYIDEFGIKQKRMYEIQDHGSYADYVPIYNF